jgi:hypothetical protein
MIDLRLTHRRLRSHAARTSVCRCSSLADFDLGHNHVIGAELDEVRDLVVRTGAARISARH